MLTNQGKDMLAHLGEYLRAHYPVTLFSESSTYNSQIFVSESTMLPRTLQSASAMLHGMFSNTSNDEVSPVIHTKPLSESEALLVWNGNPSVVLWSAAVQDNVTQMLSNAVSKKFSVEELATIGSETGLDLECNASLGPNHFVPFTCALDAQDVVTSFMAQHGLSATLAAFPTAASRYVDLTSVLEAYNSYSMWEYDDKVNNGAFQRAMGTLGYELAMKIIGVASTQLSPLPLPQPPSESGVYPVRLQHYSGHDTTLMPLWMTLGNYSLLNPLFAATMLFEFYSEGDDNASLTYVVARYGHPGQTPDDHAFAFEPYTLYCMSEDGEIYPSTPLPFIANRSQSSEIAIGCLLDDWTRFISSRGPTVADGECFAMPEILDLFGCNPVTTYNPSAPLSEVCLTFRMGCGAAACALHNTSDSSIYAMLPNYTCLPIF